MLRALTRAPRLLRSRQFSTSFATGKDPWPLPHTPEHLESTKMPGDLSPLPPLQRPNESTETMRARLVYQSRKRGTLESDLLLSTFARDALEEMGEDELKEYDKVLSIVSQDSVSVLMP
jgi:succinate dehydrogenase assembly factor 2